MKFKELQINGFKSFSEKTMHAPIRSTLSRALRATRAPRARNTRLTECFLAIISQRTDACQRIMVLLATYT